MLCSQGVIVHGHLRPRSAIALLGARALESPTIAVSSEIRVFARQHPAHGTLYEMLTYRCTGPRWQSWGYGNPDQHPCTNGAIPTRQLSIFGGGAVLLLASHHRIHLGASLTPPLPGRLVLLLLTRETWGCFWKARSDWTVNSVAMFAVVLVGRKDEGR